MSEVPSVPRTATLIGQVAAAFEPDGILACALPDFEPRPSQIEMAGAVARAFEDGGMLLAEAGTGTGKTLAYLVPAILSRQRVLVSTGTKNLQEQIFFKDLPLLQHALGVSFTAACMKGRGNYLCLHRLGQLHEQSAVGSLAPGHEIFLPIIREWSGRTETGDRAELEELPEELPLWNDVAANADTCLGTACPSYDQCFVTRMRQQAAAADIVIVNHHLLCADAAIRQNAYGEVIPACSHAILDEAHQIEDIATQYFGFSISNYRVEDFACDVERLLGSAAGEDARARDDIARALDAVREHARTFFTELAFAHSGTPGPGVGSRRGEAGRFSATRGEERVRATDESLADVREAAVHLIGAFDLVEPMLQLMPSSSADGSVAGSVREDLAALGQRAAQLRDELRFLTRASDPEFVYFVEFRGRGVFLKASPIDISTIARELLFDRMRTTVLTSATLSIDGTFEYVRDRLGIRRAEEIKLASEFDYTRQTVLYLPPRMPDPRSPEFVAAAGRQIIDIVQRTHGRAFVLFTSYAMMRAVQGMAEMALDYPILVQGSLPRTQLLQQFRTTPHAVLLATSSFWQGVDVIGEALSCVIIDKLPFASPSDPVTAARIEAIQARGGEAFNEYQVPLAILALQQGLGRLVRHRRDRGVLAVLDPRLRTKGYGRRFLASLPQAPIVHDLGAVDAFLQEACSPIEKWVQ